MILVGLTALALAWIQHHKEMKVYGKTLVPCPTR